MADVLSAIFPVFTLIFCGWFARSQRWVGQSCTSELNKFVVNLALPALLADIIINSSWRHGWHWGFISVFSIATLLLFAISLLISIRSGNPWSDAVIDSLSASYANTGFMGFPLLLSVIGEESRQLVLIATLFTVCILFALAVVLLECSSEEISKSNRRTFVQIFKKPIIVAPLCASFFVATDISLFTPLNSSIHLLGASAAPCALITIGMFLNDKHSAVRRVSLWSIRLVLTKLVVHPLIVFLLAFYIFELDSVSLLCAVTLAALPVGTGPFMLAEHSGRNASMTSQSILLSTLLSPLSLLVIILLLAQ